jgi:hypothetical protein
VERPLVEGPVAPLPPGIDGGIEPPAPPAPEAPAPPRPEEEEEEEESRDADAGEVGKGESFVAMRLLRDG